MISKIQLIIEALIDGKLSDDEIAINTGIDKSLVQVKLHQMNFNKRKYKEFSTIRTGKKGDYVRELISKDTDENEGIDSCDRMGRKGIKQFDGRRKQINLLINTRQGNGNRITLMQNVLKQNLDISIEAQKLLQ